MTTEMITDGMYVVAEHVEAGSTYYYRGMNLIGYVANDEIGYYRFNAHGDVVAVADVAGKVITEYDYDPFGKLEDDENEWLKILFGIYVEDNNPFRYCAEYYDSETEFIYLRARYYSPDLQRFISEDPIRDGNNWYAYCGNNAVKFIDPLGFANIPDVQEMWRSIISVFSPKKFDDVSDNESSIIMIDNSSEATVEQNEPLSVQQSTIELIKQEEGTFSEKARYDAKFDRYTIGYGNDFTKDERPDLYQKYVVEGQMLTQEEADALLIERVQNEFGDAVDSFIQENDLVFTQNQYDALVSFFYNNGKYVFSSIVYNSWISKGGEHAVRAEARKALKKYLIDYNGNYDSAKISELFIAAKGPNIKYDYLGRRTREAELFNRT